MTARRIAPLLAMPVLIFGVLACDDDDDNGNALGPDTAFFITESAILTGLAPGAVFPFVDTTPRTISLAHIAVTDATSSCQAGAAAPASVQVLVGEAGVTLVPVMTATTNTGITTTEGQCVFHVTVTAGQNQIPARVTDIVVANTGPAPLTGVNTITISAEGL